MEWHLRFEAVLKKSPREEVFQCQKECDIIEFQNLLSDKSPLFS